MKELELMTELEFIEEIAEGNLTKNDIIKYAEGVCDKIDLLGNIFAHIIYLDTVNGEIIHYADEHSVLTGEIKVENHISCAEAEKQNRLSQAIEDIENYFSISLFDDNKFKEPKYSEELLDLFNGHEELIDELIGKSDDEKAKLIRGWNTKKDVSKNPYIKNYKDRLRKEFATQLKKAGLISESIENFRKKLS